MLFVSDLKQMGTNLLGPSRTLVAVWLACDVLLNLVNIDEFLEFDGVECKILSHLRKQFFPRCFVPTYCDSIQPQMPQRSSHVRDERSHEEASFGRHVLDCQGMQGQLSQLEPKLVRPFFTISTNDELWQGLA